MVDRVVASINGQAILFSEVAAGMERVQGSVVSSGGNPIDEQQLYDIVLNRVIEDVLQRQRVRELGIVVDEGRVDETIARLLADAGGVGLGEYLRGIGQAEDEFREAIRDEIAFNDAVQADNRPELGVGRSDVDEELRARLADERTQEHLLEHLQVPPDRGDLALAASALPGEDFAEFARRHSVGEEGVSLGWRTLGELPTAFVEIVGGLRPGQVSEAVELGNGFHVLHLLATRPYVPGHSAGQEVRLKVLAAGADATDAEIAQALDDIVVGADGFDSAAERLGGAVEVVDLPFDRLPAGMASDMRMRTGEIGGPFELDGDRVLVQVLGSRTQVSGAEDYRRRAQALAAEDNFFQVRRKWLEYLRSVGTIDIFRAGL